VLSYSKSESVSGLVSSQMKNPAVASGVLQFVVAETLVFGLVDESVGLDPGHHAAKLFANFLDLVGIV
jgi:hypothetical protein